MTVDDEELTPERVADLLGGDGGTQLVDVRTEHEHDAGRIAGDRLIVLGELAERAGEIERAQPVVFYCRSGSRSAMATAAFRQAGFDAHNLAGGLLAWVERGLPIVPEDGHVADG